jgi:hypothetical protein
MDSVSKNPDWFPIEINFDFEFIKEFPKGVIFSVLSPKALLPLNAMFLALGNNSMNKIDSYVMFMKNFKDFFVNLATKINSIFVKIIFESVKEDIKKLIQSIVKNITSEKNKKRLAIILSLTQIISSLAKILTFDLRECKNIIQELQNLLNLASKGFGTRIPLPLLLSSKFLEGFSASRAFIETIGELEKLGIPTGPMPDGSPNKYLIGMKALIDSVDKEEATNGQVQVACEGFSVTPIGITTPGFCFGKKI